MPIPSIAILAAIAILSGSYNFFIKAGSDGINQILGAVILQVVAASIGCLMLLVLSMRGTTFQVTTKGCGYAILAGVAIGIAEILSFYLFSRGMSASLGIPLIVGGTAACGALLGVLFLGETLSFAQFTGVVIIVFGSALLLSAK